MLYQDTSLAARHAEPSATHKMWGEVQELPLERANHCFASAHAARVDSTAAVDQRQHSVHSAQIVPFPRSGNEKSRNERLYSSLIDSGESYETLARKIGVDPKTVQRWVSDGGRIPYARIAKKAADVLGMDIAYLWPSLASKRKYPARRSLDVASEDTTSSHITELASRRDALQADINRLQAELDYLNAILSVPAPACSVERRAL